MAELSVYEILNRKRRGGPLEPREVETFIDRYTRGEIPDYQMSALLMAIAINGMTAALYPARVRNTGMGWALGVGRLGGIAGPWLGGALLELGWPPRAIFLFACVTALVATLSVLMLRAQVRRPAAHAVLESA